MRPGRNDPAFHSVLSTVAGSLAGRKPIVRLSTLRKITCRFRAYDHLSGAIPSYKSRAHACLLSLSHISLSLFPGVHGPLSTYTRDERMASGSSLIIREAILTCDERLERWDSIPRCLPQLNATYVCPFPPPLPRSHEIATYRSRSSAAAASRATQGKRTNDRSLVHLPPVPAR